MLFLDIPGGRVPALGFGTWQLTGGDCRKAVEHALAAGYRHLDTAQIYHNEAEVGAGLAASGVPRADVFLTTKVWRDRFRRGALIESVHESLGRLSTDYVDLLLLHWPVPEVPLEETLEALQQVQREGKTRHIGVSNFPSDLLERALAIAPGLVTDQVEYHPTLGQDALLDLIRARGLFLTAYTPLGRGKAFGEPAVRRAAEAHGKTPPQVLLRWLLQQDRVAAIPRSGTPAHIEANLDVFDFALTDDEMDAISALARGLRLSDPDFAPGWD